MIRKILILMVAIGALNPSNLYAICSTGKPLNPMTDICWECIFPIRVAGVEVASGHLPDRPGMESSAACICPIPVPPFQRIGVPISFWEPARLIEVVKDPYCFPSIGAQMGTAQIPGYQGGGSSTTAGSDTSTQSFAQAHFLIFPVWTILELLTDFACVEQQSFDVGYLTEVDPLWNDDLLSAIISPEAMMFANPVSQMACMADAASSAVNLSLAPLYWCAGSWGSVYPLTGHVSETEQLEAHAAMASRLIFKLSRQGMVWDNAINLCSKTPTPIWIKDHYRIQLSTPIPHITAHSIGTSSMLWGPGKAAPGMDNHTWTIFKKRACCAL